MKAILNKLGIHKSWHEIMIPLFKSKDMYTIQVLLGKLKKIGFNPIQGLIFRPFSLSLHKIRVVILGQCPYPKKGQATGLAFAVEEGSYIPYSLRVIMNEVERTYHNAEFDTERLEYDLGSDLLHWEKQGVLLLNTALTVQEGKPGSHIKYWRFFISRIIEELNKKHGLIFCLWGKHAIQYENMIEDKFHYILKSNHPAKGAYGKDTFIGCNHFKKMDEILLTNNGDKIYWDKYDYEKQQNSRS